MKIKNILAKNWLIKVIILFTISGYAFGQTTGKISGKITDISTGDALPGVNLILTGTYLGAATDPNGNFYLL